MIEFLVTHSSKKCSGHSCKHWHYPLFCASNLKVQLNLHVAMIMSKTKYMTFMKMNDCT